MKKTAAILAIVIGSIIAGYCLIGLTTDMFWESSTYYVGGYYGYGYVNLPRPLDTDVAFFLVLMLAVAVCMIVFASLFMRSGRQKACAITVLVLSCVTGSIVLIVLFWIYLVRSGKEKSAGDALTERMAFLKRVKDEGLMTEADYKKMLLAEVDKIN